MFDFREYYADKNEKVRASYEDTLARITEIRDETNDYETATEKKDYFRFFNVTAKLIIEMAGYERLVDEEYFEKKTFDELKNQNAAHYKDILPENYDESYANPAYSVSVFGDDFGQLLSHFYMLYRGYIGYAFMHKIYKMEEYNRLFIEVFGAVKSAEKLDYEALKAMVIRLERDRNVEEIKEHFERSFSKDFSYYNELIQNSDLTDLRYLFKHNRHITDNEIKKAEFLLEYPEEKIKKLATQVARAYIAGFERNQKDISQKETVKIGYKIGYERIIRELMKNLEEYDLHPLVAPGASTNPNKQYQYDHKFDIALLLDEKFIDGYLENYEKATKECEDIMKAYSGQVYFDTFGEQPFSPEKKEECLQLSEIQQKLYHKMQHSVVKINEQYTPRAEVSFTLISFPSPEIGDNFEQIFEDILEVNMLNTEEYEHIQQDIIDALDKGDYVHVKGKGENLTDVKVNLQKLETPETETNFLNCGADVNIPVGEVFTSPQLKGTNGVLNFRQANLRGMEYKNLKIVLEDGFVTDYSCDNFDDEKDGKKYIEENLLFPHKTLPLGEFAIGTNTLAYVLARKHEIMKLLPILIIEKMGPHFAIGDTCFTMQEDQKIRNRTDNKEVIARENEKTAMRKKNPQEAYTFCHTDMILPYEEIEFISVVTHDGETIDILRDGTFVLDGTQKLNEPLKELGL